MPVNLQRGGLTTDPDRIHFIHSRPAFDVGYNDLYDLIAYNDPPYLSDELNSEWKKGWTAAFKDILAAWDEDNQYVKQNLEGDPREEDD